MPRGHSQIRETTQTVALSERVRYRPYCSRTDFSCSCPSVADSHRDWQGQPTDENNNRRDRRFQQSVLDQPRARRINDASHVLGLSRTTIYNLAAMGKIRLIKI